MEFGSWEGSRGHYIMKKVVSDIRIKGYVHHASRDEPQYLIQSDKTDHVAIHKGKALRHIQAQVKQKSKRRKMKR